jgi:hypothetical protein
MQMFMMAWPSAVDSFSLCHIAFKNRLTRPSSSPPASPGLDAASLIASYGPARRFGCRYLASSFSVLGQSWR